MFYVVHVEGLAPVKGFGGLNDSMVPRKHFGTFDDESGLLHATHVCDGDFYFLVFDRGDYSVFCLVAFS